MEQIKYIIKERTEKIVFPKNLGFGQIFTDHIFEMDYTKDKGWHNPTIKPLENLTNASCNVSYSLWSIYF